MSCPPSNTPPPLSSGIVPQATWLCSHDRDVPPLTYTSTRLPRRSFARSAQLDDPQQLAATLTVMNENSATAAATSALGGQVQQISQPWQTALQDLAELNKATYEQQQREAERMRKTHHTVYVEQQHNTEMISTLTATKDSLQRTAELQEEQLAEMREMRRRADRSARRVESVAEKVETLGPADAKCTDGN